MSCGSDCVNAVLENFVSAIYILVKHYFCFESIYSIGWCRKSYMKISNILLYFNKVIKIKGGVNGDEDYYI